MSFAQTPFDRPPLDRNGVRLSRGTALARNWWALVLRGIVALVFGVVAFLMPVTALGSLVLVFGFYALIDGAFAIVAAMRAVSHHGRWTTLLLEGLAGIVFGLVAILLPGLAITVWVLLLAAWALVTGVLLLVAAFHTGHTSWLMALGGAVSLIWGVLLVFNPFGGAVVLTIWLGIYAVIFGFTMIALGLRLRSRHTATGVY